QRMADAGQMNTNLVRASGFQATLHLRYRAGAATADSKGLHMGNSGFGCNRVLCAHAHRHTRITAYWLVDRASQRQAAMNQGQVLPVYRTSLQLTHKMGLCRRGACNDQQARGVFVQPVNNACTRYLAKLGEM